MFIPHRTYFKQYVLQIMPEKVTDYKLHREIIDALLSSEKPLDKRTINRLKNRICGRYHVSRIPSNADVLQAAIPEEVELLRPFLLKRPVRTISGVAVIAAMTRPHECPHGKCAYCPGGPDQGVPQSYTGHEPATMRGIQHDFDSYNQVLSRLNQLKTIGHSIGKIELIVMGGDWCSKPSEYRIGFVKGCLDAMNGFVADNIEKAQKYNETANIRNTGITFETRPDQITTENIDDMLQKGATRIEIGVQTLSDDILEYVERGHDSQCSADATKLIRDSGLKICYHIMPGLPNSSIEKDLETFDELFSDSRFRPDMLKIYPTIVVKNTKLYDWWKKGIYQPYNTSEIVSLVADAVSEMPEYVRIQRMQRDIPLHQIEAGLDKGNLRELVQQELDLRGLRNPTIRHREVGHYMLRNDLDFGTLNFISMHRKYEASNGEEVFLSVEDDELDVIIGFLRLRYPGDKAHRAEVQEKPCMIIRELRVHGPAVKVGTRAPDTFQHLGIGEKLVEEALRVAREDYQAKRVLVNSGIGVKEYYRSLGFEDIGPYLKRNL